MCLLPWFGVRLRLQPYYFYFSLSPALSYGDFHSFRFHLCIGFLLARCAISSSLDHRTLALPLFFPRGLLLRPPLTIWVFLLASLAGPFCALAPSGLLHGYCCCLFPLRWSSSRLHISALSWVVRQFLLWFLGNCPLSSRLLVSAFVPRSIPLGYWLTSPASPSALRCLSLLGFLLSPSGISACAVLSLRLWGGLRCIRYCFSLAHVGFLHPLCCLPFSLLCLLFYTSAPILVPGAVPFCWAVLFVVFCGLPLLTSVPHCWCFILSPLLSVVGSHPSLLALPPLGLGFSSLVMAYLV